MEDASTFVNDPSQRAAQVNAVINDCLRRRQVGEVVSDDAVIAAHAELMPELAEALHALRLVASAVVRAQAAADETLTGCAAGFTAAAVPATVGGLTSRTLDAGAARASVVSDDMIPGYEIVRELSRGGQGVVFEALQLDTKRRVAIKLLLGGELASPDAQRRFEREIELSAQLQHANIITIFHSGLTQRGLRYFVMDFVDGLPIHRRVRAGHLSIDEALNLFVKVCDAVAYAHRHGIIHRDLKPSNILVTIEGEPRILDFGLAKSLAEQPSERLTLSEQVLGTPQYMSPEQVRSADVDTRSDVYALGVILYEMLTGQLPYDGGHAVMEWLRQIASTPARSPTQAWLPEVGVCSRGAGRSRLFRTAARPRCPIDHDLETILLKALSKEPARRYQSVEELSRDVRHYQSGEAIEARRNQTWYVLWKWTVHHAVESLAAACVLAVIVAAVATTVFYYRNDSQTKERLLREQILRSQELQRHDAVATAALQTVRQSALGLFVEEWRRGRRELAERQMQLVPAAFPERRVMEFLLDERISAGALFGQLPADQHSLGMYVLAERAWQEGRLVDARRYFQQVVDGGQPGVVAALAQDRLYELGVECADQPDLSSDGRNRAR